MKQEREEIDPAQGKLTLAELCDRYSTTIQHQKPKTIERKTFIVQRIRTDWPTGRLTQVAKIKPSDIDVWLSRYRFGSASRNLHISCAKELFNLALRDRIISASLARHLRYAKREKPIRLTPTITYRHKTSTGFAIPIFPQVRPLLARLCNGKTHDARLFKIFDAKKALAGACRRLGYPPYSQRSLRRMFITRAIELGVDVKVIAEWQGHKDGGKLILDTYSHVNRAHSHRMAQLMTDGLPENVVPISPTVSQ